MLLILCAALLCLLSLAGLRQGFVAGGRPVLQGFDGHGVLAGFLLTAGAALFFGPFGGLSLVVALLLHETGHWVALRIIGRDEAAFRLFPLLAEPEVFARDRDRAFHALMGPGLSVAPMVLALALALALVDVAPEAAGFCRALAMSLALLSLINLLPFRALDGGHTVEAVARALSPSVLYLATASAVAGLALLGLTFGLLWPYVVAVLGLAGLVLRQKPKASQPMTSGEAGLVCATWIALIGAHVSGGSAVALIAAP